MWRTLSVSLLRVTGVRSLFKTGLFCLESLPVGLPHVSGVRTVLRTGLFCLESLPVGLLHVRGVRTVLRTGLFFVEKPTCWSPMYKRSEVSIEDRALGTRAEVNSSRWLLTKLSCPDGGHRWMRSGKWEEFSPFFFWIMSSR